MAAGVVRPERATIAPEPDAITPDRNNNDAWAENDHTWAENGDDAAATPGRRAAGGLGAIGQALVRESTTAGSKWPASRRGLWRRERGALNTTSMRQVRRVAVG